jgi:hypothetical protein
MDLRRQVAWLIPGDFQRFLDLRQDSRSKATSITGPRKAMILPGFGRPGFERSIGDTAVICPVTNFPRWHRVCAQKRGSGLPG